MGRETGLRPGQPGAAVSTFFSLKASHQHMARTVDYQRLKIFSGAYLHVFPPGRSIYNAKYPDGRSASAG
jgi:hypothetical protein